MVLHLIFLLAIAVAHDPLVETSATGIKIISGDQEVHLHSYKDILESVAQKKYVLKYQTIKAVFKAKPSDPRIFLLIKNIDPW